MPYGSCTGPPQVTVYGTVSGAHAAKILNVLMGVECGRAGPVYGLFIIFKPVRSPYAYNACIKTL